MLLLMDGFRYSLSPHQQTFLAFAQVKHFRLLWRNCEECYVLTVPSCMAGLGEA